MLRLGSERDELSVVADQIGTPTYAADLAEAILTILPKIKNKNIEIFHYSNEGVCSWYDFANAIFEMSELAVEVYPIGTSQYPTPAARPFFSVLNKNKMKEKYHINIPYWRYSVKICLRHIKNNMNVNF
jgi:dTDP-4-dehydrorhamnose reductase